MVTNLTPGTYTSTEIDPAPDFDLEAIDCDDGDRLFRIGCGNLIGDRAGTDGNCQFVAAAMYLPTVMQALHGTG